jgi:hypothetical protein
MVPDLNQECRRYIEEANQTGLEFLFTDLEVGLTFLQVADTTNSPARRSHDLDQARLAYRTVVQLLPRVVVSPEDQALISPKLEELRSRLERAGYPCET